MLAGFYTYTRADEGGVFYVGNGRGARAHSLKGRKRPEARRAAQKKGVQL